MEKSYIWSIPTRVFHALFVVFIVLAFLSDDDKLLSYHAVFGYAILILLIFRLYWGFFGPKYSKFKNFPMSKKSAVDFFNNLFEENQKYVGHNPLASYVMMSMFIVVFLIIISGGLTYGIQEEKGIFSNFSSYFGKTKTFEEIHKVLANILIALIVTHLSGIAFDRFFHKKHEALKSIVTGYKMTHKNESIKKLTFQQKAISILMLGFFIFFLIFNLYKPDNIFIA